MSSRNLLNLVLLIVIAALVAVVVYEPGKKVTPVVKLTPLSKSDVNKIEISRIGAPKVVLEKKGSKWQVLQPYAMPANDFKVEAISELAEAESKAHYPIKQGEDLKPYGLDIPRITIIFNDKYKLEFGKTDPLKYQRYIRDDNTLHLIFDRPRRRICRPCLVAWTTDDHQTRLTQTHSQRTRQQVAGRTRNQGAVQRSGERTAG